jgi:membrane-bound serine protease (ClpP class)
MLPKTSLYNYIVLDAATGSASASRVPVANSRVPIGAVGVAHTTLRPSGKADFDGQPCDVVTGGDFIEPGAKVRVVAMDGTRVVVEAA